MDLDEHVFIGTQLDEEALTLVASQSRHVDNSSSSASQGNYQVLFNNSWGILRQHSSEGIVEVMLQYRIKDGRKDTCYVLGRSRNSDIPIPDRRVSSTHCAIYCDYTEPRMRVFLEDCSANGTYVNDALTKLSRGQRMELRSGDEIYLINPRTLEQGEMHFHPSVFVFINMRDRILATREIAAVPITAKASRTFTQNINPTSNTSSANRLSSTHPANAANEHASSIPAETVPQIEDLYIIGDQIGSGMSGQVYLCIQRATGRRCAVKIIDTRKFSMTPGLAKDELLQEAALMQELKHEYVIEVIDTFNSPTAIYIVMELLEGGDLFDRIVERIRYSEDNARKVMFQILTAVHYLHSKRVVHRDLKPENILLVSAKDDTKIKVTDFGLAKKVSAEGLRTFCGTPQYFAPEVLLRRNGSLKKGAGHYGMAADMWSVGVIMYIMLSGTFPFDEDNLYDQIEQAKYSVTGNEWNPISWEAKHMIRSLLTLRADQRLTTQEALQHPWILNTKLTASYVNRLLPVANAANTNNCSSANMDNTSNNNANNNDNLTVKSLPATRKSNSVQRKQSTRGRKQSLSQQVAAAANEEPISTLEKQPSLLKRSSLSRLSFVVKSATNTQQRLQETTTAQDGSLSNGTSLLNTVLQKSNKSINNVSSTQYENNNNHMSKMPVPLAAEQEMPSLLDICNVDVGRYMTPDEEEIRATNSLVRTLFSSPAADEIANENTHVHKTMEGINTNINNIKTSSPLAISKTISSNAQKRTPRMTMTPDNAVQNISTNNGFENKILPASIEVVEGEFKVVKNLTGGDLLKYSHMDMATDEIDAFTSDEEKEDAEIKDAGLRSNGSSASNSHAAKGKAPRARSLLSPPKIIGNTMQKHLLKQQSILQKEDQNVNENVLNTTNNTLIKSPTAAQKSILKNSAPENRPRSNNTSPVSAVIYSLASISPVAASSSPDTNMIHNTPSQLVTNVTATRKRKVNFAGATAVEDKTTSAFTENKLLLTDNGAQYHSSTATTSSKRQRSLRDLWAPQPQPSTTASVVVIDEDSKSLLETHHTPANNSTRSLSTDNNNDNSTIISPVSTSVSVSHMKTSNLFSPAMGVKKSKPAVAVVATNRTSPAKFNRKREQSQSADVTADTTSSVALSYSSRRKLRTPVHSLSALFANQQILPYDAK